MSDGGKPVLDYSGGDPRNTIRAHSRLTAIAFALLVAGYLLLLLSFNETLAYGFDGTKLFVVSLSPLTLWASATVAAIAIFKGAHREANCVILAVVAYYRLSQIVVS